MAGIGVVGQSWHSEQLMARAAFRAESFPRDTSAEVQRILIERWRAMPSWKKAQLIDVLSRDCLQLALAGIRQRYPDAARAELCLRLAALRIERDLMIEAFGWDPRERTP